GVDFVEEALQERSPSRSGRLARVVAGVDHVGAHASPEGPPRRVLGDPDSYQSLAGLFGATASEQTDPAGRADRRRAATRPWVCDDRLQRHGLAAPADGLRSRTRPSGPELVEDEAPRVPLEPGMVVPATEPPEPAEPLLGGHDPEDVPAGSAG